MEDRGVEVAVQPKITDTIVEARSGIQKELQSAQRNTLELSILITKLRQELKDAETPAKEYIDNEKKVSIGQALPVKQAEGDMALHKVIRAVEAAKNGVVVSKTTQGQELLVRLSEKSYTSYSVASAIEANLADYLIGNKNITVSTQSGIKSDFEQAFENLKADSTTAATLIGDIVVKLASEGKIAGLTEDAAKEKLEVKEEEKRREPRARGDRGGPIEAGTGPENEVRDLIELYPRKDHGLIYALYNPKEFESFIQREYYDKIRGEFVNKGLTGDRLEEEIGKELSERLRHDIALIAGRLYQNVDESHPAEFWEEAEKRGGFWRNPEVFSENLLRQIRNLRNAEFSEDFQSKIKFFIKEQETYYEEVPAIPRFDNEAISEETRKFVKPLRRDRRVDIGTFLHSVETLAHSHEIQTRKFLHNGRALVYNPVDTEKGYYASLSGYADKFLPATSVDILFTLPDAEDIMAASQLEDKLFEADFARTNWVHQPGSAGLGPLGMTELDEESLERLMMINPKLKDDEWRAKRALIMGIGDNYTISLKHLENGAYADPSMNPEEGMGPTYGSYGPRDSLPYMAFNMLSHDNMRWQAERLWLGNLLFLPVRGKNLAGRFGFMKFWDHRTLLDEMKKSIDSYIKGRPPEDVENGVVRWIDIINPGRVGSIYTRGGWREFYSYESHLVRPSEAELKQGIRWNIVESWKALENVGVECLKDFVGRINKKPTSLDKTFFTDAGKDNRRGLMEHIYKKYFSSDATAEQIEAKFKQLEKNPDQLESAYKTFFYQSFARAIKQRMPTKFIRLERNRFVSGRERAWREVQKKSELSGDDFHRAANDIITAEVYLRGETSKILKDQYNAGKKLNEIQGIDYTLTEEKLRTYLSDNLGLKGDPERMEKAIKAFKAINGFADGEYLDRFGKKYEADMHEHGFPFAIAVEELDRSLLAHRAAGERTIARALGDTSMVEMQVAKTISGYFKTIQEVAVNGKKDISEIVNSINTVKTTIEMLISKDAAHRIAHHMAALTISYFKKDTVSDNIFTRWFVMNKPHSLAAEFAGTWRGVWEWQPDEIVTFCNELEKRNILPKEPFEKHKAPEWEKKPLAEFNFLGQKIIIGGKRKPDNTFHGKTLREDFGGTWKHLLNHILNKYFPLFALFILFQYFRKAYSESVGQKK